MCIGAAARDHNGASGSASVSAEVATGTSCADENTYDTGPRSSSLPQSPHSDQDMKPSHSRSFSAVSISTDSELVAFAELMSPSVMEPRDSFAEEQERSGLALEDEELDMFVTPFMLDDDERVDTPRRAPMTIPYIQSPPTPSSSKATSLYSVSDIDHSFSDDYGDRACVSPSTPYAFHLPRPRASYNRDSHTPSLISSSSSSTHFSQSRSSPPSSPIVLNTPVDATFPSPYSLDIIEESDSDEQDIQYPHHNPRSREDSHIAKQPPLSPRFDNREASRPSTLRNARHPSHVDSLRLNLKAHSETDTLPFPSGSRTSSGRLQQTLSPQSSSLHRKKPMPPVHNNVRARSSSEADSSSYSHYSPVYLDSRTASPGPRMPVSAPSSPLKAPKQPASLDTMQVASSGRSRLSASSESPSTPPDTPSTPMSLMNHPTSSTVSLTRLFSSKSRTRVESKKPPATLASLDPLDGKARKAEEKRAKRLEMERLAEELKARKQKRVAAADKSSLHSSKSGSTKRGQWEDPATMYGGIASITL
ncbi:hypothetical protein PLICRDRAFT_274430 [Plicaturopsis crispa FD-325 SS-3]|nr:hypothetical protein PLICRDRAFT_274430 [Plicaturopsis crispa FD-325 SS-3]